MSSILCYTFLFSTITSNVQDIIAISSLDDGTYTTFLDLLKGEFNIPLRQRSTKQKSALVRFWRNRDHFSLLEKAMYALMVSQFYEGRLSKVVAKVLKKLRDLV